MSSARVASSPESNARWGWQRVPANEHVGQSLDNDRSFGEPRGCGLERLAMVVHLAVVVEDNQPLGKVAGQLSSTASSRKSTLDRMTIGSVSAAIGRN